MATHSHHRRLNASKASVLFFVMQVIFCTCSLYARSTPQYGPAQLSRDTTGEEKVDYIARIYFSGKNKSDINVMILTTLQDLEGAQATASVAKQYAFLSGIKDRAAASEYTTCDLLEILAAGLYALDANEAAEQQVLPPGNAAKGHAGDALLSINNTFGNLSSSTGNTAYNAYILSRGKVNVYGAANAVSTVAGTASTVASSVSAGRQVFNEGKKIWKSIGGGNGPCKKVPAKIIPIGKHEIKQQGAPQQNVVQQRQNPRQVSDPGNVITTIISIPGISSGALRSLTDSMETRPGVQTAIRSYNETLSTITVTHSGSTDDLADWIEDKFGSKYKLVDYSAGKISIAPKGK